MDTTERELSMLPVRVPEVTAMDVYDPPFLLCKVLEWGMYETTGRAWAADSAVWVEVYGYAKSPFVMRATGPFIPGVDASWRWVFNDRMPWWSALYATGIYTTNANAEFRCNLSALPAGAKSIRSVSISLTVSKNASLPLTLAVVQIVKSDGVTPLTAATAPTISGSGGTVTHRPAIVEDDASEWTGAQLRLLSGTGSGKVIVQSPEVEVSYGRDMSIPRTVEATGQRFVALNQWGVAPGDWCYVQKFPWRTNFILGIIKGHIVQSPKTTNGFAIQITPTGQNTIENGFWVDIDDGMSRSLTVVVTRHSSTTGQITLSVVGLQAGVTASLNPSVLNGTTSETSTLTLSVASGTATQRFMIMVVGTSGDEEHQEYGQILVRRMSGNFSIATAQPSYSFGLSQISIVVNVQSVDMDFATVFIDTPLIDAETGGGKAQNYSPVSQTVTVGEMSAGTVTIMLRRDGGPYIAGTYTVTVRGRSRNRTVTTSFTLVELP